MNIDAIVKIAGVIVVGFFTLAVIGGMLAYVLRRDFKIDLGAPTPEQARVRVDAAAAKETAETTQTEEAIIHAKLDENIARARTIADRGKLRRD